MIHRLDPNHLLLAKLLKRKPSLIGTMIVGGICIALVKAIYWLLAHETIFRISRRKRDSIKRNGLVHYTTVEKAKIIVRENKFVGNLDYKSTFPSHRGDKIVWFMSNNDSFVDKFCRWCVLRRHSPTRKNYLKGKVKYEVKLFVKDFSDEQIERMKINIEGGIGCYAAEVDNVSISYAQLDGIDCLLGVMNSDDSENKK